jgi:histidinol-phosphate aminotransferase
MSASPAPADVAAALRHVKPSVRALGAYTLRAIDPRVKLNQNESPYDLPEPIKLRIRDALADRPWNRYPPFVASGFIGAVAEATGWPQEGVLVANGSNELIQATLAVTVGPGVSVVVPEPTFTLYRLMTAVNGGTVVPVPLRDDLSFDVGAIVRAAIDSGAAVVVLCTPNNPTGAALTRDEILRVHDATDALILLDQAYVEFGGYDAIELLEGRPRLAVLRTYSKAMALAGLRAGYMLAHPALAAEVHKAKLPYNVNFFTEFAAAEVMRSRAELEPQLRAIRSERDRLFERLSALDGIRAFPSAANFLCFRVEAEGVTHTGVFDALLDRWGVLVRDVSGYPMLEGCLRVNAGTPAENDLFLEGLTTILDGARP